MSRDYANRKSTSARHVRSTGRGLPGWLWALAGLSLGLAVAAFVYIGRPLQKPVATAATGRPAPESKKPVPVPPKEPTRFSFYEMLPSYEVIIPGKEKGKDAVAPIAEPGEYVIQVGSFRRREEADAQKARLALIGIEARVEQVTIDNQDTWFRVRIGPEKDQAKVQLLLARLNENSIESYLMKVKR